MGGREGRSSTRTDSSRLPFDLRPFVPSSVTILEAVLTFLIDSYRSIYLCALELIIFGALAVVIGAVEEVRPSPSELLNSRSLSLR